MARLVFLGRLEDIAGGPELACPLAGPTALADLLQSLSGPLATALQGPKIRVALNGVVTDPARLIVNDSDELAFLPPVSGG